MPVHIRPASEYSISQLLDIYNLTRSDYLVPMQMAPADLEEYLQVYDITLDGSVVAELDGQPAGINLLGIRGDQGWVTRLGVAAKARRRSVAKSMMEALLEQARRRDVGRMWLEVIADNQPGRRLFQSFGFEPCGELIVAERPDAPPTTIPVNQAVVQPISGPEILEELARRDGHVDWKNHIDSLSKLGGLNGLSVKADSGSAWVAFRPKGSCLEKTILGVTSGHVGEMGWTALHHLQLLRGGLTLKAENVPAKDETWGAYLRAGFQVSFRRIEMSLSL
jgi:ribosomal protein S18 acetylase RimI-like enzyme